MNALKSSSPVCIFIHLSYLCVHLDDALITHHHIVTYFLFLKPLKTHGYLGSYRTEREKLHFSIFDLKKNMGLLRDLKEKYLFKYHLLFNKQKNACEGFIVHETKYTCMAARFFCSCEGA